PSFGLFLSAFFRLAGTALARASRTMRRCTLQKLRPLRCRRFDDFESQLGGFPFEKADLLLAMLSFVELRPTVHELHSVAQHAVDKSGQLGCHGLDCDRSSELGSESTELGPQISVAESQGAGRHL